VFAFRGSPWAAHRSGGGPGLHNSDLLKPLTRFPWPALALLTSKQILKKSVCRTVTPLPRRRLIEHEPA